MNPADQDFPSNAPPGRIDRARRRRATGDQWGGKDVSPVSSDVTGVRNGGERGREDATRPPRRRYITY
jgi:hypothetical protein